MALSVYVHAPFCRSRCPYCAFYSGEPLELLPDFPAWVAAEAPLRRTEPGPAASLYFGGGNPALLGPAGLGLVREAAEAVWGLEAGAEVSLEIDPADPADLADLRAAGITRLSVGVQALDDRLLEFLGRRHDASRALSFLDAAAAAGFPRLAADLLYGLPDLPPERLAEAAVRLADLGVTHLSAYSLELHPGTALHRAAERGSFRPADDALEEAQWCALAEALAARGLRLYEVSSFARPGAECRHNRAYWDGSPYVGLGPGAHGFAPGRGPWGTRWWNAGDLRAYAAAAARGEMPPGGQEELSREEALLERLFLDFRCAEPFSPAAWSRRFRTSPTAGERVRRELLAAGLVRPAGDGAVRPTPSALRRADGLAMWAERLLGDDAPAPGSPRGGAPR